MHALIEEKLPEIESLCKKHSVESLYLFGSYASGQPNEESDVDFLVNFKKMTNKLDVDQFFDFTESLKDLLKMEIDVVTESSLSNPYLIESIQESRVQLYGHQNQKVPV
jgi:predicted nucleotidyltransferase